jgi:transposase
VLRARTPAGVEQEVYALPATYQALRLAMTEATATDPAITRDRSVVGNRRTQPGHESDCCSPFRVGGQWGDHRQVSTSILWKLRAGAPWRDMPERHGPWKTAHERLRKWTMELGKDLGRWGDH